MKIEVLIPDNKELESELKNIFRDINEYSQEYVNDLWSGVEKINKYIDPIIKQELDNHGNTYVFNQPVFVYIYFGNELGNLKKRIDDEIKRVTSISKQYLYNK